MTIRSLLAGCWFAHSKDAHWTGNVLTCQRCWEPIPILAKGEAVPKAKPQVVRGVPKMQARVQRKDNVREFRQSER